MSTLTLLILIFSLALIAILAVGYFVVFYEVQEVPSYKGITFPALRDEELYSILEHGTAKDRVDAIKELRTRGLTFNKDIYGTNI